MACDWPGQDYKPLTGIAIIPAGAANTEIQVYVFAGSGNCRPQTAEQIDQRTRGLLPALRSLSGLSIQITG